MKRSLFLVLLFLTLSSCGNGVQRLETDFKVVVLGFDGVDPDLIEEYRDQLPNIVRLSEQGTLSRLGTTNPPESPVAWASFATGMNPGKHGIFDFLRRDPHTYFPDIGLVQLERPRFLFGTIPYSPPRITNNRKGTTFWRHLDDHGVATTNLRLPLEFPPQDLSHGITWSGLSVPDIRGTWGTYFYLATDLTQWDLADTEFGGRLIRLEYAEDGIIRALLDGPYDPRVSDPSDPDYHRIQIPLQFAVNEEATAVSISLQGQEETVAERNWSDWFEFHFEAGPFVQLKGISRFYVLETFPELRVYLMPISLDPVDPPLPMSSPEEFTSDLVERNGYFKTLGWIHETWGLNEEQISEEVFLEDLFRNMDNIEDVLLEEMDRGESSLYTAVFTATDSVAHMFYRLIDPEHPRFDQELADLYGDAILRVYQKMDSIIGEVEERLDQDDLLIVLSDHGFHTWRREFNTNTWLVRNGFMVLEGMESDADLKKLDDMFSGGSFFPNVDWSRTRAYALGLGHIYINLKGREARGIVEPGDEYRTVISEIRDKIIQHKDPDTDEAVLHATYFRDDIYQGNQLEHAGDIQISFKTGYRTSWQTSLGAVPENIIVANLKKWSGDHCASDFSDTSGFFVSNRKLETANPHIYDIAPTLYELFDIPIPDTVDGKPLHFARTEVK